MNKKNSFLWGSATAAYQCEGGWQEGGKGLSNWDTFCHSEKNNINPVTGDIAADNYHKYEEDIKLLAKGGQNAYRFSLSWSRIIPQGVGAPSKEGLAHYKRVIEVCQKYHITPLVTLYHYDLPQSLYEAGGWESREIVFAFEAYARVCFEAFGELVDCWATVNEPNYETYCCYLVGNYPPNVTNLERRFKAMYHLILASAAAIKAFRSMQCKGSIGIVSDSYSIETLSDHPSYLDAARLANLFFNRSVNDVCVFGSYQQDFIEKLQSLGYDLTYMKEEDKKILESGIVDYLGINAYNRTLVKPYEGDTDIMSINNTGNSKQKTSLNLIHWFAYDEDPSTKKNAWGMELYPKAIFNLLTELKDRYHNIPVIITENGVGHRDVNENGRIHDPYRIEFHQGFLYWIKEAIKAGCDVRGYFVWSAMDLYSWINGYEKRYGLIYIDYTADTKRIPKDSYYWYKNFIEEQGADFI